MSKSIEEIKASFEAADANKDLFLSDVETATALTSLGLTMKKEEVDLYVKTVGQSNSGLIDYKEFELLVRFSESHYKWITEFLLYMGQSLNQLKQFVDSAGAYYSEDSHVKIHISDQDSKNSKFLSSVTVLGGSLATNPHLAKIITESHDSTVAIVFDVGVKNGPELVETLNEKLAAFKEALSDSSHEVREILKSIDLIAIPTKTGVRIIIDFSKDSVFKVVSQIFGKRMDMLEKHPLPLCLQVQTTIDFDNLNVPFAKSIEEMHSLDFESFNFAFSHLLNNSEFKEVFKSMVDTKSPFSALMSLLVSIKTLNFIMKLDHKMRSKLSVQVEQIYKNACPESLIDNLVNMIAKYDGYSFLEIFDDAREIFRILKKNETSHAAIFLKLHNNYLGADIRANAYKALNQILKLE